MGLRILPSDPGFQDVEFIADWIAKLTPALAGGARENAHLFHDLKDREELFEQLMH
jgi:hypothetical protein